MLSGHMSGKKNYGKELFMVMVFQMWHKKYIEKGV